MIEYGSGVVVGGSLSGCEGFLRRAAESPRQRGSCVRLALGNMVGDADGAAVIRPGGDAGWSVEYVGERGPEMRRWISERLDGSEGSLDSSIPFLSETPPYLPDTEPVIYPLHPGSPHLAGVWLLWPRIAPDSGEAERVRGAMETLIEVENMERIHFGREGVFDRELVRTLQESDGDGLPEMLALAREVSGADFTYWGSVHEGIVDVEWNVGARDARFGFELPLGEGVGGRVFTRGEALQIRDYRDCQYRYPGVSEATDDEEVRSVIAIPVRGGGEGSGAVLYAVRRTVAPFSDADLTLLTRVRDDIEPVSGAWTAPKLSTSNLDYMKMKKIELRRLLLECDLVRELEAWIETLLRGSAILTDSTGHPYVPANLARLEKLRIEAGNLETFSHPGGMLHVSPAVDLPLEGWPDFIEDALAAAGVVIDRVEKAHDRLNRRRSHWIQAVSEGKTDHETRREGNRLGLPVERGEVWAFAWEPDSAREQTRLRMLADDIVLDLLGSPLITLDNVAVGVVLLRETARTSPSSIRDELLKHVGPSPLWLAHGASYDSPEELKEALLHATGIAERLRSEDGGSPISEVNGRGLDSLLESPKISGELAAFADKMLKPLLDHDREKNSDLTGTFCLALASCAPEEAAEKLFVHPNTIRYRMRQAEKILDTNLARPKERTAMTLAAFAWLRRSRLPG